MAPKRGAAAKAESSASSYTLSSSGEDGSPQDKAEEVRLSSPSPKKKQPQKPPAEPPKPVAKPSPNPPAASEDEDDESEEDEDVKSGSESGDEDGSSEDDASESEEEGKNRPPPPAAPQNLQQPSAKPIPTPPSDSGSGSGSSDDSDSETDADSDEAPAPTPASSRPSRAAGASIKPINTKPMDSSLKQAPTPLPSSGKRKHDPVELSEQDNNHGGQKRQMFQRLWSLEDEIALLNGLVEYRNKNNTIPASAREMEDFFDFIKGTVQAEVTNTQLSDKVRRLKKKYMTNSARAKKGVAPTFSNSHEQKAYEVSKQVWGSKKAVVVENDDHSDDSEDDEESKRELRSSQKATEIPDDLIASKSIINDGGEIVKDKSLYPYLWETVAKMADEYEYLCGVAIKRALAMLDDEKAKHMEEKLKKLGKTEIKQHLRRIDLNKETVKLILDSLSRSERSRQEQ